MCVESTKFAAAMLEDSAKPRRRGILKTAAYGAVPLVAGSAGVKAMRSSESDVSSADVESTFEELTEQPSLFIEGLDVPMRSDTATPERADLAVFGPNNEETSADRIISALNAGTTVAYAGRRSTRRLLGRLQDRKPESLPHTLDSDEKWLSDLEYTLSVDFRQQNAPHVTLAYPTSVGAMDTYSHIPQTDPTDSEALEDIFELYEEATLRPEGGSDEFGPGWEYIATTQVVVENCPGGEVKMQRETQKARDRDGWVAYRFLDDMLPSRHDDQDCSTWRTRRNSEADRYIEVGGEHDGEWRDYGPSTTEGQTTAHVGFDFGSSILNVAWEYEVPDVVVEVGGSHLDEARRWEHDITSGSSRADSSFKMEPGITVEYPANESIVGYDWEEYFRWSSRYATSSTFEDDGSSATYIG